MSEKKASISRIIACPKCRKKCRYDDSNPYRPFCSRHCQDDDVIAWAEENYRLPDRPADPDEMAAALIQKQRDSQD